MLTKLGWDGKQVEAGGVRMGAGTGHAGRKAPSCTLSSLSPSELARRQWLGVAPLVLSRRGGGGGWGVIVVVVIVWPRALLIRLAGVAGQTFEEEG